MQAESQTNIIPDAFLCPISQEMMVDPVMAADGHTYERENIVDWLKRDHKTSPMTGEPLKHLELTQNFAIKKAIEEFKVTYARKKEGKGTGFSYDNSAEMTNQYKSKIAVLQKQLEEQRRRKHVSQIREEPTWQDNLPGFLQCFGKKRRGQMQQLTSSERDLAQTADNNGWTPILEWIQSKNSLKNMENLVLYGKGITRLDGFNALTGLKRLSLYNNRIQRIDHIDKLTQLTYLGLEYNQVQKIENLHRNLALEELDLYHNKVAKIENLLHLPRLRRLVISKNPAIERIGIMGMFQKVNQQPGIIDTLKKEESMS